MSVFESLMTHTFTVYRAALTADGQGGWVRSYAEAGTIVGRLRPSSGREREEAAQLGREISHVLYAAADEDVQRGDRVVYGELTVEVVGVREPSLAGHHWEIDCLERQAEAAD